jgi:hypothetical protein
MSHEEKSEKPNDLSNFDVYDEDKLGQYEDPNGVQTELSDGQIVVQEADGSAYIVDSNK